MAAVKTGLILLYESKTCQAMQEANRKQIDSCASNPIIWKTKMKAGADLSKSFWFSGIKQQRNSLLMDLEKDRKLHIYE